MLGEDFVASADLLIQANIRRLGIDGLRRVGVESSRIDVGAIGSAFGYASIQRWIRR